MGTVLDDLRFVMNAKSIQLFDNARIAFSGPVEFAIHKKHGRGPLGYISDWRGVDVVLFSRFPGASHKRFDTSARVGIRGSLGFLVGQIHAAGHDNACLDCRRVGGIRFIALIEFTRIAAGPQEPR